MTVGGRARGLALSSSGRGGTADAAARHRPHPLSLPTSSSFPTQRPDPPRPDRSHVRIRPSQAGARLYQGGGRARARGDQARRGASPPGSPDISSPPAVQSADRPHAPVPSASLPERPAAGGPRQAPRPREADAKRTSGRGSLRRRWRCSLAAWADPTSQHLLLVLSFRPLPAARPPTSRPRRRS